jgi:hypothetical protein
VKSGLEGFKRSLNRHLREAMTLTLSHCIFMQISLCKLWQKNRTRLILLSCLSALLILTADESLAQKAKRVITGQEAELFDSWVKAKDGTEYGFGVTKVSDLKWVFAIIIAQALAWVGMFVFKMIDWWKGGKDVDAQERKKDRQALLQAVSDIHYVKQHMMTEVQVAAKVREEIKYLKDHKSIF